jgi:hypothetical protein
MKEKIMNFLKTIGSVSLVACGLMMSVNAWGVVTKDMCKGFVPANTAKATLIECNQAGFLCAKDSTGLNQKCTNDCPTTKMGKSARCYQDESASGAGTYAGKTFSVVCKAGAIVKSTTTKIKISGVDTYINDADTKNIWGTPTCSTSCFWDASDDYYTVKISGKKHVASLNNPTAGLRTFPGDNKSYYYYTGKECSTIVEFKCSSGNFSRTMPTTKVYRNCVRKNGDWDESPAEWSKFP